MKKIIAILSLLTVVSAAMERQGCAASFEVTNGQTNTTAQTLSSGQTGVVDAGGTLSVGGSTVAVTVMGTSSITNSGTMKQTGTGRVIRDNTGGLTLTVTNNQGATMQAADGDVIQMNKASSNVTFYNYGTLTSLNASAGGSQAIDFNAITTGSNTLYNYSTGLIQASEADAVRPGVNGYVYNDGTIISTTTTGSSSDGIDGQSNSGITIVNATTASGNTPGTGLIEGARHGITGGNTDTGTDGTYVMTITNNLGGTIQGDNGSGINIDGFNAKEVITITNIGTITGNGVTGDGDGVDVDGIVNLVNFGTIKSLNSFNDTSEGVTVGGGTIINFGTIEGDNSNGGVGRGMTLAGIDKDPDTDEPITPPEGIYADTVVLNGGLIKGQSDSAIAATGAASGFTIHIANLTDGIIEGGGNTYAIQLGEDQDTVTNYGHIIADTSGLAVNLAANDDTMEVEAGSNIKGLVNGGIGSNTLNFDVVGLSKADEVALANGQTVWINGTPYVNFNSFGGTQEGKNFSSYATNGSNQGVAQALDAGGANPGISDSGRAFLTRIAAIDPGFLGMAMTQLSPTAFQNLSEAQFQSVRQVGDLLDQRFEAVRSGGPQVDLGGVQRVDPTMIASMNNTRNMLAGLDMKRSTTEMSDSPQVSSPSTDRWGFFANGNAVFADQNSQELDPGYNFTAEAVTIGVDYKLTDHVVIGVFGGYAHTDANLDGIGSTSDINSGLAGIYGSWFEKGWFLNGTAIYGHNNYDNRRMALGDLNTSNSDGNEFGAQLKFGRDFKFGAWTLTPELGTQFTTVLNNSFNESGPEALAMGEDDAYSFRTSLGGRVAYNIVSGSAIISPEFRASWEHEFLDDSRTLNSSFTDSTLGGAFGTTTAGQGRDFAVIGTGVTAKFSESWSATVNYNYQVGGNSFEAQEVDGGVRFNF